MLMYMTQTKKKKEMDMLSQVMNARHFIIGGFSPGALEATEKANNRANLDTYAFTCTTPLINIFHM